jgi:hypothetical protein
MEHRLKLLPSGPSFQFIHTDQEEAHMNDSFDQALRADPDFSPPPGAFPVWSKVFTRPAEGTFVEITAHRDATAKAAYIWVFIAGTLSGLINSLTQFAVALAGLREAAPELGQLPGAAGVLGTTGLLGAICSAPIAGLFSLIGFALGVAIVHATARFFGGQGSFDKLAYAFGAIAVPFSLISAFMVPLNAIPFVAFCTLPALLALGVYVLFLELTAIKAVHRFGWGEAAAALFLPSILIALLCGLLFLIALRMAGPAINDIFQQLQQLQ